jgi:hypothetical protein
VACAAVFGPPTAENKLHHLAGSQRQITYYELDLYTGARVVAPVRSLKGVEKLRQYPEIKSHPELFHPYEADVGSEEGMFIRSIPVSQTIQEILTRPVPL